MFDEACRQEKLLPCSIVTGTEMRTTHGQWKSSHPDPYFLLMVLLLLFLSNENLDSAPLLISRCHTCDASLTGWRVWEDKELRKNSVFFSPPAPRLPIFLSKMLIKKILMNVTCVVYSTTMFFRMQNKTMRKTKAALRCEVYFCLFRFDLVSNEIIHFFS